MKSIVPRGGMLSLCVALLALSCATGSGSSYSHSLSSDEEAARKSAQAKSAARPQPSPEPSRPAPPPPRDDTSNGGLFVFLVPAEPTGHLAFEALPAGAEVYVDGSLRFGAFLSSSAVIDLPVGSHEIELRAFGRETWRSSVFIRKNETIRLSPTLAPLPFSIVSASASPDGFDPSSPGFLGSTFLTVEFGAPGSTEIAILDASGSMIRDLGAQEVGNSTLYLSWDGRDEKGRRLPFGEYRLRIEGSGLDGTPALKEISLHLESGRPERYWLSLSGSSGPLLVPEARTLPPASFQSGAGVMAHVASPDGFEPSTWPIWTGFRLGLTDRSELSGSVTGVLRTPPLDYLSWMAGGIQYKYSLVEGPTALALALKGSFRSYLDEEYAYYPPSWDGLTDFGGLSLALPLEWDFSGTRGFLAPELMLSLFYPGWEDERWTVPGLFSWAYLRAGAEARIAPDLVFAVSAALRTEPFGAPLGIALPLSAAAELHWYLPGSALTLSAYALAEYEGPTSYAVYGGLGLGFAR